MPDRKRRGRETETLVAAAFSTDGWPFAIAANSGANGRDVLNLPGLSCEVKARAGFDPMANLRQAIRYSQGDVPFVVMRPHGYGPTTIDEWPVLFTFGQARRLLRLAGYGDPLPEEEL